MKKILSILLLLALWPLATACGSSDAESFPIGKSSAYPNEFIGTWEMLDFEGDNDFGWGTVTSIEFSELTEGTIVRYSEEWEEETLKAMESHGILINKYFDIGVPKQKVSTFIRGMDNLKEASRRFTDKKGDKIAKALDSLGYEFDRNNIFWDGDTGMVAYILIEEESETKLAMVGINDIKGLQIFAKSDA